MYIHKAQLKTQRKTRRLFYQLLWLRAEAHLYAQSDDFERSMT